MITDEERDYWQKVLEHRLTRFTKLAVKLPKIPYIICSDLMLLNRAVAALYPKEYGQAYAEGIQKLARIGNARCIFCGSDNLPRHDATNDMCENCIEAAQNEEDPPL